MRIGVISDTHGSKLAIERGVKCAGDVSEWLHLGDFSSDAEYLKEITGLPVTAVCGNCDGLSKTPSEFVKTIGGVRIFMTHGHIYDVNSTYQRLRYRAEELECTVALYGHTHMPHLEKQGDLMILNPGSALRPIGVPKPSIAVLTIENAEVNAEIITFDKPGLFDRIFK